MFKRANNHSLMSAFVLHQANESPAIMAYYDMAGGALFVDKERWKNFQKEAAGMPHIASIVRVLAGQTSDTGETVYTLFSSDGSSVDLWMHGDMVRAIHHHR